MPLLSGLSMISADAITVMATQLQHFCSRLSDPATPFDWLLGISLIAALLLLESTFLVAHKSLATNTPVHAGFELDIREAGPSGPKKPCHMANTCHGSSRRVG